MKLMVQSVNVGFARGEFVTVDLKLICTGGTAGDFFEYLKPGSVLTEFGIAGVADNVKETKLSLPSRKLCLD